MATAKPTVFPRFASVDLLNGTGGAPNVVEPSTGKKDSGWNEGERPPRETFNWLHRITNDWLVYIDCALTEGVPGQFDQDVAATSGLDFAVGPGRATVRGDEQEVSSNTVLALVDDAVNFVFYVPSTNTVDFEDEAGTPPELDGGKDVVPLFRVTTVGGAITLVEDLRTWLIVPNVNYSELDTHELRTAGLSFERVNLSGTTPEPDVALANVFRINPTGAEVVTVQDALNTESLDAQQTDILYFLIEFAGGASGSVLFSSQYEFFNTSGSSPTLLPGAGEGPSNDCYLVKAVWDANNNQFVCELIGGAPLNFFVGRRGALAYNTGGFALNNDAVAPVLPSELAIPLQAEAYDTDSIHDNITNNSRLTVPSGVSVVRLTAFLRFTAGVPTGLYHLRIRKNGGTGSIDPNIPNFIPHDYNEANSTVQSAISLITERLDVSPGDYFEMYAVGQNVALTTENGNAWLEMEIIE